VTDALGTMRREGDAFAVRLERTYEASPAEVWAAVTDPASIKRWLFAEAILEPRVGGRAEFRWSDAGDDAATGSVLVWDPPRLLELSWAEQDAGSIVRIELEPLGSGTLLVLDHSGIALERTATGLGAGWHSHLVALGELLAGSDAVEDRWWSLYQSVRPRYEELARRL
jgi:uncharacterized protein YndB with AHSA1/START domain